MLNKGKVRSWRERMWDKKIRYSRENREVGNNHPLPTVNTFAYPKEFVLVNCISKYPVSVSDAQRNGEYTD